MADIKGDMIDEKYNEIAIRWTALSDIEQNNFSLFFFYKRRL